DTAHAMTHKRLMREAFLAADVPQPPFATLRSEVDIDAATAAVDFPAVLKPVDSGGQRAVLRIEDRSDLEENLAEALAEAAVGEAMVEELVAGAEMTGIVVVRAGRGPVLPLSDRLRPPGIGFGVGWMHVYPPSIDADQLERSRRIAVDAAHALG